MNTDFKIEEVITKEEVSAKVKQLAVQIKADLQNTSNVIFIGLLKGGFIFMADLFREIGLNSASIDFMFVSSYGNNASSSGNVKIIKDLDEDIASKEVIIIEDIVDTGLTLQKIVTILKERNPKSLKICTLLNKQSKRITNINVDYIGFEIEDFFVVGYGIDYAQKYRNLPYLAKVIFNK